MSTQLTRVTGQTTSLDVLLDVLSDPCRRSALSILQGAEKPMHMADLAREVTVATDEHGEQERVYRSLYHNHVPKLADAGLVAVDADRKTVELVGEVPDVEVDGVAVTAPSE